MSPWRAPCPSLELADGHLRRRRPPRSTTTRRHPVLLAELHGLENREVLSGGRDPAGDARRHRRRRGPALLRAQGHGLPRHPAGGSGPNVRHREVVQGGSTITQQLIKNAFVTDETDRRPQAARSRARLPAREAAGPRRRSSTSTSTSSTSARARTASRRRPTPTSAWMPRTSPWRRPRCSPVCPRRPRPTRPAATRGRPRPARPGAQQDVPAALHHQRAAPGSPGGPAAAWPTPKRDAEVEAPYWVELVREQLVPATARPRS